MSAASRGMIVRRLTPMLAVAVMAGCTDRPTPPPPTLAPAVFGEVSVISVGRIPPGEASATTLELRFTEPSVNAIPAGAGSFRVTLTDQAGAGDTVSFTGPPAIGAPGSLGTTVELAAGNVLKVSVVDSDPLNVEPITLSGFGIRASSTAALGPINAVLGDFAGSLAGGAASNVLASPGEVVTKP